MSYNNSNADGIKGELKDWTTIVVVFVHSVSGSEILTHVLPSLIGVRSANK